MPRQQHDASSVENETARRPLTPKRVIAGAVALADEIGIDALTIRRLAEALDVKPMAIYHHVANKEAIIDGMVDHVFAEIELPPTDLDWRSAIIVRSHSMRRALARHPWASPLMETRTTPGRATLRHHDAVVGCFRNAGFSLGLTGHAYAVLDAFLYGFALQEASLPATGGEEMSELAGSIAEAMPADLFPHLTEFTIGHVLQPGYDFGDEFEFGLGLVLDGLERAAADER
ncbi:MAG: TetR/AcrR family transcriptional regulator [Ilumatobacteraceae bacterium]|nr:TetR/AcrR family transcriptional regulator [Ilumatobacteraceae bacterium]